MPDNVEEIAAGIHKYYGETGRTVSLIGRSLGGLVARHLLQVVPELIDNVIFLGTPHKGTRAAWLNYPVPCCRDMVPGSDYIRWLSSLSLPNDIPITNVYTKYDLLIKPWQSARLDDQENIVNIRLDAVGHISIAEELVYEIVSNALRR